MSTLHNILGKRDTEREPLDPSGKLFPELDLEKIKHSLKLEQEGRERGEKNTPPSASEALDDIEHQVIAAIETEQRHQQQTLNNQLSTYYQRVAKLDLAHEAINIASAAQRASTEFIVKVDEGKAKLFTLWRNVCMIENQWNDFRKKHELTHPADYPLSRLWNFTVILVILAIESVLNGTFLARGLETGLLGGIVEAFAIAAINVSFGFFLGDSVVRYVFHRSYILRVLAFIEIPISGVIAIFFNLLVGHYRDALGGPDPAHASSTALYSFRLHPFDLAAIESWVLFALGLFFSTVAAVDGFKMNDPYPGYGKISRKHEEIIQEYTDEKANIVEDLSRTCDQALDYMRNARQNLASRRAELSMILDQRENLLRSFEANHNHLNRGVNDLLATYRNANMRARTTPAPARYNRGYTLPKPPPPAALPPAVNDKSLDANIDKTDEVLQKAISQVNAQLEEAVREFHQIGEFTSGNDHAVHPKKA
ncbi:MAG: hypothetical protein WCD70_04515 [Alphaproteobacteria bacterium]